MVKAGILCTSPWYEEHEPQSIIIRDARIILGWSINIMNERTLLKAKDKILLINLKKKKKKKNLHAAVRSSIVEC